MKTMLFDKPVHNPGMNLTVRRGIKWALETEADIQGLGPRPITTRIMCFDMVIKDDLATSHDPAIKDTDDLFQTMKRLYTGFDWREVVTLVEYEG